MTKLDLVLLKQGRPGQDFRNPHLLAVIPSHVSCAEWCKAELPLLVKATRTGKLRHVLPTYTQQRAQNIRMRPATSRTDAPLIISASASGPGPLQILVKSSF